MLHILPLLNSSISSACSISSIESSSSSVVVSLFMPQHNTAQQSRPGRRRSRRTIMIATCAHFICDSSRREYSVREEVSQQGADRRLHGAKKGKKLGSLSMPIKLWYTIYKWGPWMNESGGIDGRLTKSHKFSPWRTLLHINV